MLFGLLEILSLFMAVISYAVFHQPDEGAYFMALAIYLKLKRRER